MFTTVALYHGTQAAIRKFHSVQQTAELTLSKQWELKQVVDRKKSLFIDLLHGDNRS